MRGIVLLFFLLLGSIVSVHGEGAIYDEGKVSTIFCKDISLDHFDKEEKCFVFVGKKYKFYTKVSDIGVGLFTTNAGGEYPASILGQFRGYDVEIVASIEESIKYKEEWYKLRGLQYIDLKVKNTYVEDKNGKEKLELVKKKLKDIIDAANDTKKEKIIIYLQDTISTLLNKEKDQLEKAYLYVKVKNKWVSFKEYLLTHLYIEVQRIRKHQEELIKMEEEKLFNQDFGDGFYTKKIDGVTFLLYREKKLKKLYRRYYVSLNQTLKLEGYRFLNEVRINKDGTERIIGTIVIDLEKKEIFELMTLGPILKLKKGKLGHYVLSRNGTSYLLELFPEFTTMEWGRDILKTGDGKVIDDFELDYNSKINVFIIEDGIKNTKVIDIMKTSIIHLLD